MGLRDYLQQPEMAEVNSSRLNGEVMEMSPTNYPYSRSSSPNSFTNAATSTTSSTFVDDIKHEVMVNYLYQQQCSHLWVGDGSGELEGVLLRKQRGNYMAC